LNEFHHGRQSGRFGELIAVKGPDVTAAKMTGGRAIPPGGVGANQVGAEQGVVELSTSGEPIAEVKRFTTIERFKSNDGKGFYVQLHPQPRPYPVTFEPHNSAVKELRKGHDGRCFRVHGGHSRAEQGILIHEAPHVGWVIGCISPRPLNDFRTEFPNEPGNPSYKSMDELFKFVGPKGNLYVLDW
jgi:hypothetical protein